MLKNYFFNNKGPFAIDKLLKLSGILNPKNGLNNPSPVMAKIEYNGSENVKKLKDH